MFLVEQIIKKKLETQLVLSFSVLNVLTTFLSALGKIKGDNNIFIHRT